MAAIYTIGHGARRAEDLVSILKEAGIETLVAVRAYPTSKRHPHFSRENLQPLLAQRAIAYDWQGKALGGYRQVPYAEHMRTPAFREAAVALAARPEKVCIMCAESNPDDCHRRHIADRLAARGHRVVHLFAHGRSRAHAPDPQEELWQDD